MERLSPAMADMLLRIPADWEDMPTGLPPWNRTFAALQARGLADSMTVHTVAAGANAGATYTGSRDQWRTTYRGDRVKAGLEMARGL